MTVTLVLRYLLALGLAAGVCGPALAAAPAPVPQLAPLEVAHTFAQVRQGDQFATLLVVAIAANEVRAVDLSAISKRYPRDAFSVIADFDQNRLDRLAAKPQGVRTFALSDLVGVGPAGRAHIAAGTNYPEHGEETGLSEAFLFPKLAPATGPVTTVATGSGVLLDYEVEVCARFDRAVRSLADFDAARKGFFLCGDFSDRATLVKTINLRDVFSGDGFPDAKSGEDRFPVGPFLVVPRDWQAFVSTLSIATAVDGAPRQLAHARDMIKGLRTIVEETLAEANTRTWSYQQGRIPMVQNATIATGSAILTGTGAGVVFQEPSAELVKELTDAKDRQQQLAVLTRYIGEEEAKRIYLQPGQRVKYASNYLGWIDVQVVAGGAQP